MIPNFILLNKNIKLLFKTLNEELQRIQLWFNSNKLSLNMSQTKYSFFHSSAYQDTIPLRLPELKINNIAIKREPSMNYLGVLRLL